MKENGKKNKGLLESFLATLYNSKTYKTCSQFQLRVKNALQTAPLFTSFFALWRKTGFRFLLFIFPFIQAVVKLVFVVFIGGPVMAAFAIVTIINITFVVILSAIVAAALALVVAIEEAPAVVIPWIGLAVCGPFIFFGHITYFESLFHQMGAWMYEIPFPKQPPFSNEQWEEFKSLIINGGDNGKTLSAGELNKKLIRASQLDQLLLGEAQLKDGREFSLLPAERNFEVDFKIFWLGLALAILTIVSFVVCCQVVLLLFQAVVLYLQPFWPLLFPMLFSPLFWLWVGSFILRSVFEGYGAWMHPPAGDEHAALMAQLAALAPPGVPLSDEQWEEFKSIVANPALRELMEKIITEEGRRLFRELFEEELRKIVNEVLEEEKLAHYKFILICCFVGFIVTEVAFFGLYGIIH